MSLINKMLLDLDRRVGQSPKKSAAARVLAGLRPAKKEEPGGPIAAVDPLRRRFELAGLLIAVLLAMGVYTWQKMAPALPGLDTLVRTVPDSPVPEPLDSPVPEALSVASAPPEVHLPTRSNEAIVTEAVTTTPDNTTEAVAPVVEAPKTLPVEMALVQQKSDERNAPKPVAVVEPPKRVAETAKAMMVASPPKSVSLPKRPAPLTPPVVAPPAIPASVPVAALANSPVSVESRPPAAIGAEKKSTVTSADVAEDLHSEAASLFEQGRLAEAYEKYREALTHEPRHIKAREGLASMLLQQGNLEEAQELLYEGIGIVPGHLAFGQQLARLYVEQGSNEKALTVLESNRELARSNAEYIGLLAAVYQRLGRSALAREAYTQALALRPLDGRLWAGLAISHEAEENWAAAREAYTRVRSSTNSDQKLSEYAERRLVALANKM